MLKYEIIIYWINEDQVFTCLFELSLTTHTFFLLRRNDG